MKNQMKVSNQNGYTLIELVITIIILGLMTYFLGSMCVELLAGSTQQTEQVEMVNLAISQMEEAVKVGVSLTSQGWTSEPPYQWRRTVTTLKSDNGDPTLIKVIIGVRYAFAPSVTPLKNYEIESKIEEPIEVKKGSRQTYSLINHIGG
jgi:prepilin-type N-terminal cleavage/methylation domain-containing protein